MKCPITKLLCINEKCFQIRTEIHMNLIGCDKAGRSDIYWVKSNGELVKINEDKK